MLINAIRAHMAELGYVMAQGKSGIGDLMAMILGEEAARLPDIARDALKALACSLEELGRRVKEVEASIVAWHRNDEKPAAGSPPTRAWVRSRRPRSSRR